MTPPRLFPLALLGGLLFACSEPGPSVEIAGQRSASRPSGNVLRDATPGQRFSAGSPAPAPSTPSDDVIAYDLPEGWRAVAPTRERLVNLRPAGHPEAECYLSFLPGDGGGLAQNVNRWRAQLGAPALEPAAVAALPTHALLGRQAALVEAEGTFTGMGSTPARPGFQLLGLAVSEPEGSLFLKFTGPAELVTAERERFLAFAGSLRLSAGAEGGEAHGPGDGHEHGLGEAHPEPVADSAPSGLRWTTPAGWRRGPARTMREVTFLFEGGGECYVTRLMGTAGGLRGNLDRWSEQMGQGRLADAAFETLPRVDVLGTPVPVLAVEGSFTGMDGRTLTDQGLLGAAVIRDTDSLFVKFTGPAALVRAERENFLAFLTSLEEP